MPKNSPPEFRQVDREALLTSAAQSGNELDLGGRNPVGQESASYRTGATIRGSHIAALAKGDYPGRPPKSVIVRGATITGPILLDRATVACPLIFVECTFLDTIQLSEATVPEFLAIESRIHDLQAPGLRAGGLVVLGACWIDHIDLAYAEFAHGLNLAQSKVGWSVSAESSEDAPTISLDRASLRGSLDMGDADIRGLVSMNGVSVRGQLKARRAKFSNFPKRALSADGADFASDAWFDRVRCDGEITMLGASVTGQLSLVHAAFNNGTDDAFSADGAHLAGGVFCEKLKVIGAIRFPNAKIEGQLTLVEANVSNQSRPALVASDAIASGGIIGNRLKSHGDIDLARVRIEGDVELRQLECAGTLDLSGAQVNGGVLVPNSTIENPKSASIAANGIEVTGRVELGEVRTRGMLMMIGAQVQGPINLSDARLRQAENRIAFAGDGGRFAGGIRANGITTDGELRLTGATVDRSLVLRDAHLSGSDRALSADGASFGAVLAERLTVSDGGLSLPHVTVSDVLTLDRAQFSRGSIDLSYCEAARLDVRGVKTWHLELQHAKIGTLSLDMAQIEGALGIDGARYDRLRPRPSATDIRLFEDRSQEQARGHSLAYQPSVYEALELALRASGDEELARKVGASKHRRRRTHGDVSLFERWLSRAYGVLVDYGFAPARLVLWFAGLAVVGVLMCGAFGHSDTHWASVRSGCSPALADPSECADTDSNLDGLRRVMFAADTVLPVVDLGQQTRYTVTGTVLEVWYAVTVCLSWILGILLVAAMGKRLVRD